MMSGEEGEVAQGGGAAAGPPGPGRTDPHTYTTTPVTTQRPRPLLNRQQDKKEGGGGPGPGPGPAIAAGNPHPLQRQDEVGDAAPAPGPGPAIADPLQPQEEVGDAAAQGPAPTTAHRSTTCDASEDPDTNPLFKDAPSRNWKLCSNKEAMVKETQNVMDWIDQLLEDKAGLFCAQKDGQSHYLHQTTDGDGFFKLVLQPDAEALAAGQAVEGVTLVFSLKNLYLLGFLYQNTWYFYSDAILDGSGHNEPGNEQYWDSLPFDGGYSKDMFTTVQVGTFELNMSHHCLSQYLNRKTKGQQDEIQTALFRIIVVISEGKRFPRWLRFLQQSFANNLSIFTGSIFGSLFQNWKKICKKVIEGPQKFVPNEDYATYGELVAAVSVLLSSASDDDEESVHSFDWQSHEATFVFDPDYDLGVDEDGEESEEDEEDEENEEEDNEESEEDEESEKDEEEVADEDDKEREKGEEGDEDAAAEEDEKGGGHAHKFCYWVLFFICIILLLVWITVF